MVPPPDIENLAPAKDVAYELGYTADYVSRLAREGKITGRKIRGTWFVDKRSLIDFVERVQEEKEERRRKLSEERHREYEQGSVHKPTPVTSQQKKEPYHEQQVHTNVSPVQSEQTLPKRSDAFAVTFARVLAAATGTFVFAFSFFLGYSAVTVDMISSSVRLIPIASVPDTIRDTSVAVYRTTGESLYSFSSNLFDGYLTVLEYTPEALYTFTQTPSNFLHWHDVTSDHLATLWVDRADIAHELSSDFNALGARASNVYTASGFVLLDGITSSLAWYDTNIIQRGGAGVAASASHFGTGIESLSRVRDGLFAAALSSVSNPPQGANLALSFSPFSWFESLTDFIFGGSDAPPTVIIREEKPEETTTTGTGGSTTVVRNITESVTISGITDQELVVRLQQLENSLRSELYAFTARTDNNISGNTTAIRHTNVINQLENVTITNPTIIGGSISGTSGISSGGSGTVDSGVAGYFAYYPSTGTAVDDQGVLYTDGTNIGIGTASPSTRLDIDVPTDISGDVTLSGGGSLTVSATGPINQTGTGQVTFAGNVNATNGLDVTTANLTVGGSNFTVAPGTGNTTIAGTLALTGALRASSTAQVDGASRFYSTLQVDGALTAAGSGTGLAVTNNATVGGTLGVTGAATFGSTVAITGTLSAGATTLSGNLELGDNKITGLANPTDNQEAANKQYVDAVAQGLDLKDSVRAATTANITLSGEQTIDGVSIVAGDRVLVKDQTDKTQNGIYVAAGGAWSRSTDADENSEVASGMFTFIQEGTINANSGWVLTTPGSITLGTSLLEFSQFSGAGQITAGTGLTKSGNTLNAVGTAGRITANADSIDIASTYVGQSSITTVGTLTSGALGSGFGNIDIGASSITAGAATFSSIEGSAITGSGNLSVSGTGSFTDDVTISGELTVATTTFTGDVALSGKKITGLADPTAAQEAATKAYVDAIAQGLTVKASVRAATTANITLSGTQTVDGVSLVASDRVLVKDQSTATENGIYVVAAGAWSRSTDADENSEVVSGLYVFVEEGTTQANTGWSIITEDPITLGSTSITFTQFSGSAEVTAGTGLTKTGNTLNVIGTADRITANADSIDIASTYVGQSSITTVGALTSGSIASGFGAINIGTNALTAGAGTFTSLVDYGTLSIGGTATTTIQGNGATSTFSGGISLADGNVNVASGGIFLIDDALVLDATTLGSSVVSSSLTTVGALDSGQITTGFGDINIGTNLLGAGTTTITNLVVQNTSTSTFGGPITSASGDLFLAGATNSDDLIFNRYGGNVGIGTTSPWARLAVNPIAGDTNQFVVGSSTATSFLINSAGNVGIGTTSPGTKFEISTGSNTSGLRLIGAAYDEVADFYVGANGNLVIDATAGGDSAGFIDLRPEDDSFGLVIRESDGTGTTPYANFYVTDNGSSDYLNVRVSNGTSASAGLYITENDTVGIGTSTPAARFAINPIAGDQNQFIVGSTTATSFRIDSAGDITTGGDLSVGGGTGKITVGTIDPVYTIDGVAYATYVSGMIGQKEEVTGSAVIDTETTDSEGNVGYTHTIDFDDEEVGSDLWLFGKATQLNKNIDKLVALLTPEGNAKVWYQVNKAENQVVLLSNTPTRVSFRFTAPRFDYEKWTNYNTDGVTGFIPPETDENFFDNQAPSFSFAGSGLDVTAIFDALKEKITLWFADIENGIGTVFARVFSASEKICIDGECLTRDDIRALRQLAATGAITTPSNGATETNENDPDTETNEGPVIQFFGNNPARVEIGTSYADLGATFTDDHDENLGIDVFVNGTEVTAVSLDTSTSTTYEITYRVTDTDGNTGEATRTVIVGDGGDADSETDASEDTAVSESATEQEGEPEEVIETEATPEESETQTSEESDTTEETSTLESGGSDQETIEQTDDNTAEGVSEPDTADTAQSGDEADSVDVTSE